MRHKLLIFLVVAICMAVAIILVSYFLNRANLLRQQSMLMKPFSGVLAPPSPPWTVNKIKNNVGTGDQPQDGLYLVGMGGGDSVNTPQISCPDGYSIKILGAYLDVVDPYGLCASSPNEIMQATCGNSGGASQVCRIDSDCGGGMTCYSGKCTPRTCQSNGDCGGSSTAGTVLSCNPNLGSNCKTGQDCGSGLKCVDGKCLADPGAGSCMACVNGTCSSFPTCNYVTQGLNKTCSPFFGDVSRCRPRDASAYLANHCDGKQVCLANEGDYWDPNSVKSVFGPLPCEIPASSTSKTYATLPISTGWGGGTPTYGESGNSPATFSQGYKVHGIYSCVKD